MHCLTRQPHTLFSAEPSGSMKNTYRFGTSLHGNIKTSLSERFLSSSGLWRVCFILIHIQYCYFNILFLCIYSFLLMKETRFLLCFWNACCPDRKALVTVLKDAWSNSHVIYIRIINSEVLIPIILFWKKSESFCNFSVIKLINHSCINCLISHYCIVNLFPIAPFLLSVLHMHSLSLDLWILVLTFTIV